MAKYYGKNIVGSLCDAQTINTTEDSSMVYIGGRTGGDLWIDVYANTAWTIDSGEELTIQLQGFTSDAGTSATSPFSTGNAGGQCISGGGTSEPDVLYYIFYNTSAQDAAGFAAGDLVTQCAIPEDLFHALAYDYVQLAFTCDTSEVCDAFVYAKV